MTSFFVECTKAMDSPRPISDPLLISRHKAYRFEGVNPIALDAFVRKRMDDNCVYTVTEVCEWTFSDKVALKKVVTCFEYKVNDKTIEKKEIQLSEVPFKPFTYCEKGFVYVNSNFLSRDRFTQWKGFEIVNMFKEVMCETAPRVADLKAMHWKFEEAPQYSFSEIAYVVQVLRERGFQVFGTHAATRIASPNLFTCYREQKQGLCVKFPENLEAVQPSEHTFSAVSLYNLSKRITEKSDFKRNHPPKSLDAFKREVKMLFAGGFVDYGVIDITRFKREQLSEFLKGCQSVFLGEPYINVKEPELGKPRTYFYSQDLTLILTKIRQS